MIDIFYFLLKAIIVVIALLVVLRAVMKAKKATKSTLFQDTHIEKVDESLDSVMSPILKKIHTKSFMKKYFKNKKLVDQKKPNDKKYFVIDFAGDLKATGNAQLRQLVSLIVSIADPKKDEVILRLDSRGGTVTGYGLAASQLQRLKDKNITLHATIDEFAASGGYMMAVIADKIYASPFSMIGSIGVVAQIPNFHRLMKKNDIDIELITAGKYKRTLTMLGKNTEQDREKYQQDLEKIHELFINHVIKHRPNIHKDVFTGEVWPASAACQHNLVDHLMTSDELILKCLQNGQVYYLNQKKKVSTIQKLTNAAKSLLNASQNHYFYS